MRIRAPPRLSEVSCDIFSSAGANDAAPSGPSSFPASIAARPLSTHPANRRTHPPPSSAHPKPHHIASKRVPNSKHQRPRPTQAPEASLNANPRTSEVERGELRHLLERRRQRCRPLRPDPIPCIHRRPPPQHTPCKPSAASPALKRVPQTTPHRIQGINQQHAPKTRPTQAPEALPDANPRTMEIRPELIACIHRRPPPQHTPRKPSHASPDLKRIPQPHHIASKRVPDSTHQRTRPTLRPPRPRPKANPRTCEVERGELRHLLERRRQRCRPLTPDPIPCIHRRPPPQHTPRKLSAPSPALKRIPQHTTSHPSAYPTARTKGPDPP